MVGYDGQISDPGQNADIVGNVLVHNNSYGYRFGGDGTGASRGCVRFVHNTVVVGAGFSSDTTLIRFTGDSEGGAPGAIDAFEAMNNLFYKAGDGPFRLTRDDAVWVSGTAKISGRNKWVPTGTTYIPTGLTATLLGASPGLASAANLTGLDVTPAAGAAISSAGSSSIDPGSGYEIASPLTNIACMPPAKRPNSYLDMVRAPRPA